MMIITRNRRYMCYMQRHRRSVPPLPPPPLPVPSLFLRPCLLMKYETLLCACPTAGQRARDTCVYIIITHQHRAALSWVQFQSRSRSRSRTRVPVPRCTRCCCCKWSLMWAQNMCAPRKTRTVRDSCIEAVKKKEKNVTKVGEMKREISNLN